MTVSSSAIVMATVNDYDPRPEHGEYVEGENEILREHPLKAVRPSLNDGTLGVGSATQSGDEHVREQEVKGSGRPGGGERQEEETVKAGGGRSEEETVTVKADGGCAQEMANLVDSCCVPYPLVGLEVLDFCCVAELSEGLAVDFCCALYPLGALEVPGSYYAYPDTPVICHHHDLWEGDQEVEASFLSSWPLLPAPSSVYLPLFFLNDPSPSFLPPTFLSGHAF